MWRNSHYLYWWTSLLAQYFVHWKSTGASRNSLSNMDLASSARAWEEILEFDLDQNLSRSLLYCAQLEAAGGSLQPVRAFWFWAPESKPRPPWPGNTHQLGSERTYSLEDIAGDQLKIFRLQKCQFLVCRLTIAAVHKSPKNHSGFDQLLID